MTSCNTCKYGFNSVDRSIPCPDGCTTANKWEETDESKLKRFTELEERLAVCEDLLIEIGDYAHNNSTGPAVPDALWEVRRMAYEQ
jgi:hypothetical protein